MLSWTEIIHKMSCLTIDTEKLVDDLEEHVSDANEFIDLQPVTQRMICEECGISDWAAQLIFEISSYVSITSGDGPFFVIVNIWV